MDAKPTFRHADMADAASCRRALGDIVEAIAEYLPPDSGIDPKEALSRIIGIVEFETGQEFLKAR